MGKKYDRNIFHEKATTEGAGKKKMKRKGKGRKDGFSNLLDGNLFAVGSCSGDVHLDVVVTLNSYCVDVGANDDLAMATVVHPHYYPGLCAKYGRRLMSRDAPGKQV